MKKDLTGEQIKYLEDMQEILSGAVMFDWKRTVDEIGRILKKGRYSTDDKKMFGRLTGFSEIRSGLKKKGYMI